MNQNIL